jgi:RNA polymerase sigma factor (TIGR02999 family)
MEPQNSLGHSSVTDVDLVELLATPEHDTAQHRQQLFTTLYAELHRVAQRELRRNAALTLSPTTLLHETFLDLSRQQGTLFEDRARFMAYAARAMRCLLIDYVRSRHAQKRGGAFQITSLHTEASDKPNGDVEFEALNEALEALAKVDPRLAECVDLRFFCGLSYEEIADVWSVSARTVRREWDKARILLHRLLEGQTVE